MSQAEDSRLAMELELLDAMYPSQIEFNARSRDLKFSSHSAVLHLRLPDLYPEAGFPEVISANDHSRNDLRNQMKAALQTQAFAEGEEALDAIVACFQDMVATTDNSDSPAGTQSRSHPAAAHASERKKTVIIWLHHLLALTKRKLALAPAQAVIGVTKPGYPGVMLFTGPAYAVDEHVNILKAENWQAFQVRYESEEAWEYTHDQGVREVETMAEVVKAVEAGQHRSRQKDEFLKAVGIK